MDCPQTQDVRQLVGQSSQPASAVVSVPWLGPRRTVRGFDRYEWAFMFVSLVNLLATIGFTVYRLVIVVKNGETQSSDFTLTILILLNVGFCSFYVIHGLLMERRYELGVFMIAIVIILLYCAIGYGVNHQKWTKLKLIRMILASILAPINIGLGIKVVIGFKWFEFRVIGPVELLQSIYRHAVAFYCLLKFDLQVSLSVVVLVLTKGSDLNTYEIIVLAVGVPFCAVWAVLGWVAVRWELKSLVGIFSFLGLASPAYIIFKLYKVYKDFTDTAKPSSDTEAIFYITIITCALSLIVHFVVYFELFLCTRNFGLGLKEKVVQKNAGETGRGSEQVAGDL